MASASNISCLHLHSCRYTYIPFNRFFKTTKQYTRLLISNLNTYLKKIPNVDFHYASNIDNNKVYIYWRIYVFNCKWILIFLLGLRCPNCRKTYKNQNTLHVHRSFDCGQPKKFSCTICSFKCKRKYNLETHILKKHNEINLM